MSNLPRNFEGVNLPSDRHRQIAEDVLSAYESGRPVVILATDAGVLHGIETLETIAQCGVELTAAMMYGIDRQEFEASDLPEFCEAARQVWLSDKFPKRKNSGAE